MTHQEKKQAVKKLKAPDRDFWMLRRQILIMELGAIEDYLEMPRSIVPKRKKVKE